MRKQKSTGSFGKGYYIALILCAAAIGISGYLYYSHSQDTQEPDISVGATLSKDLSTPTIPAPTATQPQQPAPKPMQTIAPVEGEIVIVYAMDHLDYNPTTRDWRVHNGIDYAAEEGAKVCAAADGTVYTVYESDTMGWTVVLRHENGYTTTYSSLDPAVAVKAGDAVTAGQQIGSVGETALLETAIGSHVHFSVSYNDEPMDPTAFLANG